MRHNLREAPFRPPVTFRVFPHPLLPRSLVHAVHIHVGPGGFDKHGIHNSLDSFNILGCIGLRLLFHKVCE